MTLPIEEWTEWTKLLRGITELSAEIAVLRDCVQQRDAEIERLRLEIDRRFGIAAEMIAARKERDDLRARLAAADALLRKVSEWGRHGGIVNDETLQQIDTHLRGAGDEA